MKTNYRKVHGTPNTYLDTDNKVGRTVDRHFCRICGSQAPSPLSCLTGTAITSYRAVMSIVKEFPDTAFVKGGLFAKTGVLLPKPGAAVFWGSREGWEASVDGAKLIE